MGTVNIKLNGQPVEARWGSTVLEAAKEAGVNIPTLCHHPALPDRGACRMCVVEIAGQREIQPACTFPVSEGLEIQTETPKVVEIRRFVLDMLFSERSHYCMYCEMSGDCELQSLAYQYGLDRSSYPIPHPRLHVDATRRYFIMDHNRCILCQRCVRACNELVGNCALGVKYRGAKTLISADMDVPFGESSCVACGTCLQVCPTGALVDLRSVYGGRSFEVNRIRSACTFCAVGCGIDVVTRADRVLRVEGDWGSHSGGVLCSVGRFECLDDPRNRVTSPMIRYRGDLVNVSWDEALDTVAHRLKAARGDGLAAWTTGSALDGTLEEFQDLFADRLGARAGVLEPILSGKGLLADGCLADLDGADTILVIGADLLSDHRVVGYRIRRAQHAGTRALVVAPEGSPLRRFVRRKRDFAELEEAVAVCRDSASPVVVYGSQVTSSEAEALVELGGRARFLALGPATNSSRVEQMGMRNGVGLGTSDTTYLLLQEAEQTQALAESVQGSRFLVAHASYLGPVTEVADAVLPALLWYEREGTFLNLEGAKTQVNRAVPPPEGLPSEAEVLTQLAHRM